MQSRVDIQDLAGVGAESIDTAVRNEYSALCARTDKYFALLMLVQWAAAICLAVYVSPLTWAGDTSYLHPHVILALLYGGVLTLAPVALTRLAPGERVTRLTIAVTQMLMSSLLIHLTGGRIETHFHVFGSLAFLAYYLDWQVLAAASLTIGIDHLLRGTYLPFSVFGSYAMQPWRVLEHIGWVLFCDIFLVIACRDRLRSLRELSAKHVERGALLNAAYHDALTGLPNRILLSKRMADAINESEHTGIGFGCLYIDLDRFKDVNDQMGHAYGDVLLRSVAERMSARLDKNSLLARVGGDEFVALIPGIGPQTDQLEEIARGILRAMLQPFNFEGQMITIGASIGISRYPKDGQDEAELLLKSDQAMYRVKHTGSNGYLVYAHELFAETGGREAAEQRLRQAISNKEFEVHYQALFHVSGAISGLEALLRWKDPVHGNIPPSYFIPMAEETGLIVQLGNFVLQEACKHAAEWRSRALPFGRIAVNVSSLQLARDDFAESVMNMLRAHRVPPESLALEITESALVNNLDLAERQLQSLRMQGMRISIDDFGTGYSSLSRLRQLTLDTLKIDRLFVDGAAGSEQDRLVVQHIIGMAHSLGMTVVAEGVETESQLEVLRALACDQVQGFLLATPVGKEDTDQLLMRHCAHNGLENRHAAHSYNAEARTLQQI